VTAIRQASCSATKVSRPVLVRREMARTPSEHRREGEEARSGQASEENVAAEEAGAFAIHAGGSPCLLAKVGTTLAEMKEWGPATEVRASPC
jgi:hypothetical protein